MVRQGAFPPQRHGWRLGVPHLRQEQKQRDVPIVINEYAWLWLNRDGTPTTLTKKIYEGFFPGGSTTEQRRLRYARHLAALTEFWRCHRECAGVLHFCGLGYSRAGDKPRPEGGATSDHFIDLEKLNFEPHFERYVRDAFSPVGLMIDFWDDELVAGSEQQFRVYVINDRYSNWTGAVNFSLARGGGTVAQQSKTCSLDGLGREILSFALTVPDEAGEYQLVARLVTADGNEIRSLRDFKIVSAK